MTETMTETLNLSFPKSKRIYKKQKDTHRDASPITSAKNSVNNSAINSNNDWHRLLLSRLKAGVTRKYRSKSKNNSTSDIISSSFEDTNVTLRSYINESQSSDKTDINTTQSDIIKPLDSSTESSIRRDNHYIKNSISNRFNNNTITSLKRRVRKQQMRCLQNQPNVVQEQTYQLPTTANLLFVPYTKYAESPYQYDTEKYSSIVQLPPLMNTKKTPPTHLHDIQLNICGY